jgi:outer membrane protein assembly factor BamB
MNSFDGKLYVSDIYRVAEIDIKKRKVIRFYEAEGAEFLNDVITDDDGNVYITDMARGSVYKIADGEITEWLPAGTFNGSNGVYYLDGMIYLGEQGRIVSIDPATKAIKTIAEFDGGVDGLEITKNGTFVFSDWSGKVQAVKEGGKPEVLFNTTDEKINAADIHLIREQNILLVPTFFDNRVVAYKLNL